MPDTGPETPNSPTPNRYWSERTDAIYLQYVYYIARTVARNANSVLDVGSNNCDYLEWLYWIDRKYSLDRVSPYRSDTVTGVKADFYDWDHPHSFGLTMCLQTMEHVDDPERFAAKLMDISHHLIVSVPYMWPEVGAHVSHYLTEDDLTRWFGRAPNCSFVVEEPFCEVAKSRRIVAYFDRKSPERRIGRGHRLKRRAADPAQDALAREDGPDPD